jgi:hypothetical protein
MKIRLALALSVLLALLLPVTAFADVTSYSSGIQLQNIDATQADITIIFYNESDGTVATTVTDTIAAHASNTYYPLDALPNGFQGSAVVQSTTKVLAIVNVMGNGTQYGASYIGFTAGATTVNLPLVERNNYGISTWFNVQNAGAEDANVTITYAVTPTCTETATIKPGAAKSFYQKDLSCLPNGFAGAASVSGGSVPVAVSVIQEITSSMGQKPGLLAYNGFTSASTNPIMPLVSSGYWKSGTGIQVQNTGATATDVTITYTPSSGFPGATCTDTKNILAHASVTYLNPPTACFTNGGAAGAAAFVGSAKVSGNSASMPLVAIVNQVTTGSSNSAAYGAFDAATGTSNVSLPLIMDRNYGYFTGFSIANVGTSPTNISCTFTDKLGNPVSYTAAATNVAPGAALTDVQLNKISSTFVGAAVCTATGGDAKIVGVVNELNGSAGPTSDALLVYEGQNY